MSQRTPAGRMNVRWSVGGGGQTLTVTASTAGLAGSSAIVWVKPPLNCGPAGSSCGFRLIRSLSAGFAATQVASLLMLAPCETSALLQFGAPTGAAKIVARTVTPAALLSKMLAPLPAALLL
jgi:hypothetical protein